MYITVNHFECQFSKFSAVFEILLSYLKELQRQRIYYFVPIVGVDNLIFRCSVVKLNERGKEYVENNTS